MAVIGFAGHAQHGKDTAAQALVNEFGFKTVAFADPVRRGLLALDPYVECSYLVYKGMHESGLPVPNCYERLSDLVRRHGWDVVKKLPEVRRLMQRYGTEAGRDIHGYDCWVNLMDSWLDDAKGDIAITDVRFDNEADLIHEFGGYVYYIFRPQYDNGLSAHRSEPESFEWADKTILNTGTVNDLQSKVIIQFLQDYEMEWTAKAV